jgi:hypothetical protein
MGHLVNPISFRIGITRFWSSTWSLSNINLKYKYLIKSEWNIHLFLMRFFSKDFLIKIGLIYSHFLFIRTSNKFICNIFYWDGYMLQNYKDDLNELFYYFYNKFLLSKFFIIIFLYFFFNKYFFSIKQFFILFKNNFLFYKFFFKFKFFYFLKKYFSIVSKSSLFYNKIFIFFSFFFFYYKLSLNYLFIRKFFKLKSFFYFFFFIFKKFCINFKNNFSIIDNFAFLIKSSILSNNNIILFFKNYFDFFFKYFMSLNNLNFPVKLIFHPMTHLDINSSFIARYLSIRLKQRYRLMQALGPVLSNLRKHPLIDGYRINASGRFTKKEIAFYEWFRFGSVPTSSLNAKLDFTIMPFVLKYSLCCFKVWINIQNKTLSLKKLKQFLYKDLTFIKTPLNNLKKKNYLKNYNDIKYKIFFLTLIHGLIKKNYYYNILNKIKLGLNKLNVNLKKKKFKYNLFFFEKKILFFFKKKNLLLKKRLSYFFLNFSFFKKKDKRSKKKKYFSKINTKFFNKKSYVKFKKRKIIHSFKRIFFSKLKKKNNIDFLRLKNFFVKNVFIRKTTSIL